MTSCFACCRRLSLFQAALLLKNKINKFGINFFFLSFFVTVWDKLPFFIILRKFYIVKLYFFIHFIYFTKPQCI